MKKLFLLSLLISLTSPMKIIAGFPEDEKGYDLKKIEESFKLPCDEIGSIKVEEIFYFIYKCPIFFSSI